MVFHSEKGPLATMDVETLGNLLRECPEKDVRYYVDELKRRSPPPAVGPGYDAVPESIRATAIRVIESVDEPFYAPDVLAVCKWVRSLPTTDKGYDAVPEDILGVAKWMHEFGPGKDHSACYRCGGTCAGQQLARFVLSLPARDRGYDAVPADDAEPVTEEWLRSIGHTAKDNCLVLTEFYEQWENGRFVMGGCVTGSPVGWPLEGKTRGHVRRLLAALGLAGDRAKGKGGGA